MGRISRHWMFMEMARVASLRSTCARGANGAILVDRGTFNVVSTGYNGPPQGKPHCSHSTCGENIWEHTCTRSWHAEYNAIHRCAIKDIPNGLNMYTTSSPCPSCATEIFYSRPMIKEIYFQHRYHKIDHLKELVEHYGIKLFQVTPNYVVDFLEGQIIDEVL